MLPLIGSLVGAGTSLLGGMMGQQNQAAINQQNIAAQEQINTQNIQNQDMLNAQNIAEQNLFAQNGIQWRVADAQKAGINPLAALGAQTTSFSNNVGTQATAPQAQASNAFGTGIAGAGQNISRAMQSMQSPEDKALAIQKSALDLEHAQLENDFIKSQIHASTVKTAMQAGQPPGLPTAVVTRNDDGSYTSGPSKTAEGWSWSNPAAKYQWLFGQEAPQWFGYNIPKGVPGAGASSNAAYRNPLTGNYYRAPTLDDILGTMRGLYGGVGTSAVSP